MNLDDLDHFKKLDTLNMLAEIEGLPDQLQQAWDLGFTQPLPKLDGVRTIVICWHGRISDRCRPGSCFCFLEHSRPDHCPP